MGQNETRVDSGRRTARRVTWGRERQPLQYVENGCTARHRPSLRQRRTAASQALGTNETPRAKLHDATRALLAILARLA